MASKQPRGDKELFARRLSGGLINGTGGWTAYGAGLLCDEARAAMDEASRKSVVMQELHDQAGAEIARAFGFPAACVVNCAAAALSVTAAAALVLFGEADPRKLPWEAPQRRKLLIQKGHALNFSAEVTQMLRLAGAEPVELGSVNSCTAAILDRACSGSDVAAGYYVQSAEAFPYGSVGLGEFTRICRARGVLAIVDASAQPLTAPIAAEGGDVIIQSPHKMMGSPTAGLILGPVEFVAACRSLEQSFGRPFRTSKETIAGTAAAVRRWTGLADEIVQLWEERAQYAELCFGGIRGLSFCRFHYPPPLQGVHARLHIDAAAFGIDARTLAAALRDFDPPIAVIEDELSQGNLLLHFAMLDESSIVEFAGAVRAIADRGA